MDLTLCIKSAIHKMISSKIKSSFFKIHGTGKQERFFICKRLGNRSLKNL